MTNRRDFVKSLIAGSSGVLVMPRSRSAQSSIIATETTLRGDQSANDQWSEIPKILARIKPPVFPQRDCRSHLRSPQ